MKKLLSLLLALTMLLSLAACGGGDKPETTPATEEPTQASEIPATQPPATEPENFAAGEMVLHDDENATFMVTKFQPNDHLGMEMHVYCENKTDKTMIFSLDGVSVCGVMHDPAWAEEVTPGKKVNSVVYFDTFVLAEQGVASLDEISFRLHVIDSDNWMDEPFVDEQITVYPTGLSADTVAYPTYQHKNGETVLLDNEKLLFIVEKVDDTDNGFYTLNCYIENRTDMDLMVSWDGVSVNGFMADPFWAAAVGAGKRLYTDVSFLSSVLAEQGIETVAEIELTLNAYDYDSMDLDYVVQETLTFLPK